MPRVTPTRRRKEIERPSRIKLLLRRQRRMLRPAAGGVIGFAAVIAAILLIHSARPGGRLAGATAMLGRAADLRVQDIVITGRANTPEPLLRAALGVSRGDPILGFSVDGARERIESLAWVEHVAVERRLPGTIVVQIIERRPFAIWQDQGRFVLIDRAGAIVANEDVSAFKDLPLVVGEGAPAVAASLLDALDAVPDIRGRVAAAIRVGDRRWNLQLRNGITVMLPAGHDAAALARLADLQQSDALLDRRVLLVDLRLPDRLVVRPKPAPDAPASPSGNDAVARGAT
jgi:cell division protein FtsQ